MATCIVGDCLTGNRCCRCDGAAQNHPVGVAGGRQLVDMAMRCSSMWFDRCLVSVNSVTMR